MGKTIISLNVVLLEEEPLPAVTFCTMNWLSIDKLKKSHEYHETYEKYNKLNQEYKYLPKNVQNDSHLQKNMTQILKKMFYIYRDIKRSLGKRHSDIYSKIKTFGFMASDFYLILQAVGVYKEQRTVHVANSSNVLGNPVESIIINNEFDTFKCFTFNSLLKPGMEKIKFKLQNVELYLTFDLDSVPKLALLGKRLNWISVHSPNSLPNLKDMSEIDLTLLLNSILIK